MVDRYTKAVLTVIAVALSGLAIQYALSPAAAQKTCGGNTNPCWVTQAYWDDISRSWKLCYEARHACYVVSTSR
jgi:hypothetical protein